MSMQPIQVTPSAYTYPLLIKQLLHTPLATAPQQEIVYGDKVRHTYRDLALRINRQGHALSRLGVQGGDTVAVMDWDSHRYLECFFGVPMLGAVLQTVNVRLSPDQILYTLNHAQASVLLVNREFLPVLAQIRGELATVKRFVLLDDEGGDLPEGFAGEYEALLIDCPDHYDFPDFDENSRATTFYTTGTTGLPKGVYFSHRQLVLHTLAVCSALALAPQQGGFHRDDIYMPLTPMFHVHAWGMPYIATLAGVKQVYPGRYQPEAILKLIEKEQVTFSHCVPTILHMLLLTPYGKQVDLSRWKVIIGGSALTTGLAKAALERGIDVFTGYGMSETCPILTLAQMEDPALLADADANVAVRVKTGRPVPLVALRTVDAQMGDCPRDGKSAGEVVVRAPWLTQGYLYNPEASEHLWDGGWLHTQDIGHIDPQGYLQVTDRIKDVIKTGGEWVSSLELEDLIGRHPGVSEVAVIGVPDEKWGERPLALVVLKPEFADQVSAADIQAHVKVFADQGHISKYGVPENVRFLASLARTSVGKLNKRAMREQLVK
ncbi:acyl-CoA synthetase (AMP-forming)/AMP-acid ligase II [Azospira oryzae PS]|uniref:Acyl-CoA synthetase (AMP-forming)/AMP-acid ligase II n=1 Tax=Azospira oryzae (strain ATCC BAA-33 / DSM 13638 / PS) TaxID=640081 RepID=G8QNE4_AZOOP|nr:fatty acid--CoA ligase [Azospira oryzae]AEV24737.1 acyl-CoA synthetase (AMP-forming)/AMP-acid ligase II [Azospira oryzae PS]